MILKRKIPMENKPGPIAYGKKTYKVLQVCVSEEENEIIRSHANRLRISTSSFLKQTIMKALGYKEEPVTYGNGSS